MLKSVQDKTIFYFYTASITRKSQKIVLKNLQTYCMLHNFKTFLDFQSVLSKLLIN